MDTLLVNGDHFTDSRGIPVKIFGERELIQRALLRLSIKKGSFEKDPALGSELYKLRDIKGGNLERAAMSYVQEALLSMPEIIVTGVKIIWRGADALQLNVSLEIFENQYQLEVDVT